MTFFANMFGAIVNFFAGMVLLMISVFIHIVAIVLVDMCVSDSTNGKHEIRGFGPFVWKSFLILISLDLLYFIFFGLSIKMIIMSLVVSIITALFAYINYRFDDNFDDRI